MLFGAADEIGTVVSVVGLAIGLGVGLYQYWKGEEQKKADRDGDENDSEPKERRCPHCKARFTDAGDAYCPECREPLDE